MPRITIPNNWEPRPYQLDAWEYMERGGTRAALAWHRRAGKDDFALHWTATQVIEHAATYWHMLPEYGQGRKAVWEAVNPHTGKRRIDEAFPPEIRKRTLNNTMTIEFINGSMWHVVGSDNYNSLVGSPPRGIVLSEWALANPSAWGFLSPILAENHGWAIFIYTPRGRNHGHSLMERAKGSPYWFAQTLRADETGVFSPEALADARQEYVDLYGPEVGEMIYEQEYFCSFEGGLPGAYYARLVSDAERQGRVTTVAVDENVPVHTAWDLGKADSTAIWCFQIVGPEVHVVDYIEAHGEELDYYTGELDKRGYRGTDWLPHDARAKILGMKRTRIEQVLDAGRKPMIVPLHNVADGINAVRLTMPRCWFDAKKAERGLDALRQYRREYNEEKKSFSDTPRHDWASHGADAFRYLAMAWREQVPQADPKPKPVETRMPTINELLAEQDRRRSATRGRI
jgi:phage terminase large subunit